jgi:hypothetical protein
MKQVLWYHPDRNDSYIQISKNILGFFLTPSNAKLGAILNFDSEEAARNAGWKSNE